MRLALPLLALALSACDPLRMASTHQERVTRDQGFEERTLALGETRLHVWVGGEGPPLLLIHGFGGDGLFTWRGQMESLAAAHTVIVPDLVWFGESSSPASPSLDGQVDAMLGLLDGLGIGAADVAGISYGGFITLKMAAKAPERVARAIIVDSPGPFFDAEDRAAMLGRFGVARAEDLFVPADAAAVERLLGLAYVRPPWIPGRVLEQMHTRMFAPYADGHRALLADLLSREEEQMPSLGARPWLVIWGEQDRVFPLETGQQLAAALGAELVVVPDTAHAPNVEKPDAFNTAILGFLSKAPDPPAAAAPMGVGAKSR